MKKISKNIPYKQSSKIFREAIKRIYLQVKNKFLFKSYLKIFSFHLLRNYIVPFLILVLFWSIYYIFTWYSREYFTSDQILHDIKINLKDPKQDFRFYHVDLKWFGEQSLVVITWINNKNKYDEDYVHDEIIIPQTDSPAIYIFSRVQKNFFENLIFAEAIYRKETQIDLIIDSKRFLNEQKEKLIKDIQGQAESWAIITDDILIARSVNDIDIYSPNIFKINDSQEWIILTFWDIRYWFSTVPVYYWLLYYDYSIEKYAIKPIVSSYDSVQNIKSLCPYGLFDNKEDEKKCNAEWYEWKIFDIENFHFLYNWTETAYQLTAADSDTDIELSWSILSYGYNIWLFSWECHGCEDRKLRTKFSWDSRDLEFNIRDNQFTIR